MKLRDHHLKYIKTTEHNVEYYVCADCGQDFFKKAGASKRYFWTIYGDFRKQKRFLNCREYCIREII